MNLDEAVKYLEKQIPNPTIGLPQKIFDFVSKITPLINVDLLIKDENGRTLLAWRDDGCGQGWYIPGGIIRFKEIFTTRIQKVIDSEIEGLPVKFESTPIEINQFICNQKTRGHCIGMLFKCFLSGKHSLKNKGLKENDMGFLKWHKSCPSNLLKTHYIYKKHIWTL